MKIAIFLNQFKPTNGIDTIILENAKHFGHTIDQEHPDIVFYVGGDGTFLRAVHHYLDQIDTIQFVGIDNGNLGFFYDFFKEDIIDVFEKIAADELQHVNYHLLEGKLSFDQTVSSIFAINEIRIENPFHTLICDVHVGDEVLETYRGNGLVVSSPLGSSAYNRSLGGALIEHSLDVLELTEIATIQNNHKRSLGSSIIFSNQSHISLVGDFSSVVVGYDNLVVSNEKLTKITISQSPKQVHVLHSKEHSFISLLNRSFIK